VCVCVCVWLGVSNGTNSNVSVLFSGGGVQFRVSAGTASAFSVLSHILPRSLQANF
jgi:hypothetical protein